MTQAQVTRKTKNHQRNVMWLNPPYSRLVFSRFFDIRGNLENVKEKLPSEEI